MLRTLLLVLVFSLTGCVGMSQFTEALAKDTNSNCIMVGTPYGSMAMARAGTASDHGLKVIISGGSCSIESVAK
jgi:hypothetical protein